MSRERWLPVAVPAIALAVVGIVVTIWRPLAPPYPADFSPSGPLFRVDRALIDAYRLPRYAGALLVLVVSVAVPLWILVTDAGRRLVARLAGAGGRLRSGAVAVGVVMATDLVALPVVFAIRFVHDGRFGFRTASLWSWLRDWSVGHALSWLVIGLAATGLMWLITRWPRTWPWRAALGGTVVAAGLVFVAPYVTDALLVPTHPLESGRERDAIELVLREAGLDGLQIHVAAASRSTTHINAHVTGLGPSDRIVLDDTLLELPPKQVAMVVAHEIGHREHRDVLRGVVFTSTGLLVGSLVLSRLWRSRWARDAVDARAGVDARLVAVAVAFAAVAQAVTLPLVNAVSRRAEAAADERALVLTDDARTFNDVQRVFIERDVVDPDPPGWVTFLFGTHPTPNDRLNAARAYVERRSPPVRPLD